MVQKKIILARRKADRMSLSPMPPPVSKSTPISNLESLLVDAPSIVVASGVLTTVVTGSPTGVVWTAFGYLSRILNALLKGGVRRMIGERGTRPCASGKSCNPAQGCRDDEYGMPSGHAQTMTWAATFATMWCVARARSDGGKIGNLVWQIPCLWIFALAVCVQRVRSRCHSVGQVFAGMVVGASVGGLTYLAASAFAPSLFPKVGGGAAARQ